MATLTLLTDTHGFPSAGDDINTDGYVAVIPAFQKVYYADGRNYDNKGFHKLDFVNTKITASGVTTALFRGEAVTQVTSGAQGVYDECTDVKLSGTQTGTFVLGEKVTQASSGAIGYVVNVASGVLTVCPVSRDSSTGEAVDFDAATDTVTGATSSATIATVTGVTAEGLGLYHFIYRTTTTEFDNSNLITGAISGGVITPTAVTAPPHWLTWKPHAQWVAGSAPAAATVTNAGIMPGGGSNIGVLCFGRIFLNSMENPHHWVCSRINYPLDFDTSQTDVAAATTSQNTPKAGLVGSPIVAMVSYKDHYLVFGCASEVYVMRSDPLMGGVNTPVSKETGFFSPESWCWDDRNNLYFLGIDGIYRLSSDAIQGALPPENITKKNIPKLISLMGLNRRTDRVAMAYDKQRYGIKVSVTQKDGAWAAVFWIDLRTGGLFPDKYPTDQSPASLLYFDSYKTSERGLLEGGYDGYIRKADESEKNDEGDNAIEAYFAVGPFVNDKNPREKIETDETSVTAGEDTDGITVELYRADSADELIKNVIAGSTPAATKTLTGDGLLASIRDRVAGRAIAHRFKNVTADESFSIEGINTNIIQSGKVK